MKYFYKNLSIWLVIGLVGILLLNVFKQQPDSTIHVSYTDFLKQVQRGVIPDIRIQGNTITWTNSNGETFKSVSPENPAAIDPLLKSGINIEVRETTKPHWFLQTFLSWVPFLLIIVLWFFFTQQSGDKGGGGKAMAFGKSRARLIDDQESKVKFKDIAGVDEAKDELVEVVDFLKDPSRFTEAGARIPKGVLLYGEPGTGKTLLAKAIAGEAGVPFFSISGSNFVEMYVGIGASRVRDLFKEGKKKAPCIIFIDEIDAVGRHRSSGGGGGNDEREQTLNQLLVEMDGFEGNEGVIIIAATNRQDILDPALLRPGRFDRQVMVPLPDVGGREQILKVHAQKIQVSDDVNWKIIAKGTPGFSGAELANMVNEAALLVARKKDGSKVTMDILEKAKDKVMMGAERRSLIITDKEKKITACHEAGHALVAWMLPGADPVHKVTIIPRGKALGLTMQLPEEDKLSHSKSYLFNNLCILLGGRVAEETVFADVTTGAGNDIDRVSDLARKMVCEWGMSEEIGTITFKAASPAPGYPGPIVSEATAVKIDDAVKSLIASAYSTSKKTIMDKRKILDAMTQALLDHETISHEDIKKIVMDNS
ncbi:MAG: ATP-dependent metallopeptidase FtsH/Yme1/Tma family protein [Deltaproteobacteria bacterium]|nr:ATP-dependent metallopeptidase FtsH/Yme1/Tma family protein [Deltaproteobacteria bacterium]